MKWTADGRSGPRPPDDDAIFGMVLAREKARLVKDYAAADRMQAEMAASGFDIVYRDATGRKDKKPRGRDVVHDRWKSRAAAA